MATLALRYLLMLTLARSSTALYSSRSSGENSTYSSFILFHQRKLRRENLFRQNNQTSSIYFVILLPSQHQGSQDNLHLERAGFRVLFKVFSKVHVSAENRNLQESKEAIHVLERVVYGGSYG